VRELEQELDRTRRAPTLENMIAETGWLVRLIADATPQLGLLIIDTDLRIRLAAGPVLPQFDMGLASEGHTIAEIFPPDMYAMAEPYYRRVLNGERFTAANYRYADSIFLLRLVPLIQAGQVQGLLSICLDVTDYRHAQDALHIEEERYRLIAESISDVVSLHALDSTFIYVTPSITRNGGWDPAEMIGKLGSDFVHPEDRPEVERIMQQHLMRGEQARTEWRCRCKDGTYLWMESHTRPIFDATGNVIQLLSASRDITERKAGEQQKLALTLHDERMSLLTRFIRDVSHEFRTPLSIINTSLYLLERVTEPESRQQRLRQIGDQAANLARLVDDMVLMTYLESDGILESVRLDINEIVRSVFHSRYSEAQQRQLQATLDLAPDMPRVIGDREMLQRALDNLLDNAIRFTPDGGAVQLTTHRDAETVVITVQDTGSGIAPEAVERVFERFYRGDAARSTRGFGLGLPIAQTVAQRHDGTIAIVSVLDEGTRVTVCLPIAPALTDPPTE
jgi:PAS domain S-box-containing protein